MGRVIYVIKKIFRITYIKYISLIEDAPTVDKVHNCSPPHDIMRNNISARFKLAIYKNKAQHALIIIKITIKTLTNNISLEMSITFKPGGLTIIMDF